MRFLRTGGLDGWGRRVFGPEYDIMSYHTPARNHPRGPGRRVRQMREEVAQPSFRSARASEQDPEFAAQLSAFVTEVHRLFASQEISAYLHYLEDTKILAPPDPNLEIDDPDDETEEEPWPENPVLRAEELFRLPHVRKLFKE